jgi:hypothetical protein
MVQKYRDPPYRWGSRFLHGRDTMHPALTCPKCRSPLADLHGRLYLVWPVRYDRRGKEMPKSPRGREESHTVAEYVFMAARRYLSHDPTAPWPRIWREVENHYASPESLYGNYSKWKARRSKSNQNADNTVKEAEVV